MKLKILIAAVLSVAFAGCANYPPNPHGQATKMLDAQVIEVENLISGQSSRLPTDRDRWSQSSLDIEKQLYSRMDDIYRQRQILAQELAKQEFVPSKTPQGKEVPK